MFDKCSELSTISIGTMAVKDKPYQASYQIVIENFRENNKLVNVRSQSKIFRDSAGNIRREFKAANARVVYINDILKHRWYAYNEETRLAVSRKYLVVSSGYQQGLELYRHIQQLHKQQNERQAANQPGELPPFQLLGPKRLENLECYGIRALGYNVDDLGDSDIHFSEAWISEDLEEIVAGAFIDGDIGTQIADLINLKPRKELHLLSEIRLGEVDPALFVVPDGYEMSADDNLSFD